jgi:hypothetical protein
MTGDWDNSAWLSPWRQVQLIVALDPAFVPDVARLAPERQVGEAGVNALFLSLHHNPELEQFTYPIDNLLHGNRAVGAFRGAMEKITDWCTEGRIACKRKSKTGDLVLVDPAEFAANKINFEKGMIGRSPAEPEQLFLNRDDTVNLCAPSAAPPKDGACAADAGTATQGAPRGEAAERSPSPLLTKLVSALQTISPEGPSGLRHSELETAIKKVGDKTIGVFSARQLSRAKALAWPEIKRTRRT